MTRRQINEALQVAGRLLQQRKNAEARALLAPIAESHPNDHAALHLLGLALRAEGDLPGARALLERAVAQAPNEPVYLSNLGGVLRQCGEAPAARGVLERALRLAPQSPLTQLNLALTLRDLGEPEPAERMVAGTLPHLSRNLEALALHGQLLYELKRDPAAIAAFQNVLRLDPNHLTALRRLVQLHQRNKTLEAALAVHSRLLALLPESTDELTQLSILQWDSRKPQAAIETARRVLLLDPTHRAAMENLGAWLADVGQKDEAIQLLTKAVALYPDSAVTAYHLAGLTRQHVASAPAEYVRSLFDEYSETFDKHLTESLGYHVPEVLAEQVRTRWPGRRFEVLDLGCGTGLSGAAVAEIATRLVGIDLAPKMLAEAAKRKLYNELINQDIVAALRARDDRFDLVLAADVFIYVGDVSDVFSEAARLLRPGGVLAFSVEALDGDSFALQPSRRFAHSIPYLNRLAERDGLKLLEQRPVKIRKEGQDYIPGHAMVYEKSGGLV